jgi:hypothetical protein
MLSAVLKIRTVEDVTLVTDTGESILTRLQSLMVKLERDVKDCGRLISLYHSGGNAADSSFSPVGIDLSFQGVDGTRR